MTLYANFLEFKIYKIFVSSSIINSVTKVFPPQANYDPVKEFQIADTFEVIVMTRLNTKNCTLIWQVYWIMSLVACTGKWYGPLVARYEPLVACYEL